MRSASRLHSEHSERQSFWLRPHDLDVPGGGGHHDGVGCQGGRRVRQRGSQGRVVEADEARHGRMVRVWNLSGCVDLAGLVSP